MFLGIQVITMQFLLHKVDINYYYYLLSLVYLYITFVICSDKQCYCFLFYLSDQRNNYQNDYTSSRRSNGNQNNFSRHNQNENRGNNVDRYGRHQTNSYRSENRTYPNYGQYSSGQQPTQRNDRPGYYTPNYQTNNIQ